MEEMLEVVGKVRGLNRRMAPHVLQPNTSPDCQNCRAYLGSAGLLGPRRGREKSSYTPYEFNVVGIHVVLPQGGSGSGSMFVAKNDGTIEIQNALFSGGQDYA